MKMWSLQVKLHLALLEVEPPRSSFPGSTWERRMEALPLGARSELTLFLLSLWEKRLKVKAKAQFKALSPIRVRSYNRGTGNISFFR
jgi:hypothetical protein